LFISVVGVVGYSWLSTESIGDIPFAELTLRQVFRHLFAVLVAIGCISWFFHFPETDNARSPQSNPYIDWAKFGGWVVALAVLAIYWTNK
jgi:Na+/H+ antiporter NhaD/arsenite permease-like protein